MYAIKSGYFLNCFQKLKTYNIHCGLNQYKKTSVNFFPIQAMITVEDENDNAPQFEFTRYEGRVKEHTETGTEIALDNRILAKDVDAGSNAQFTINLVGEGSQMFLLDQKTGRLYLSQHALLDRERKDTYNLKLVARDKGEINLL